MTRAPKKAPQPGSPVMRPDLPTIFVTELVNIELSLSAGVAVISFADTRLSPSGEHTAVETVRIAMASATMQAFSDQLADVVRRARAAASAPVGTA